MNNDNNNGEKRRILKAFGLVTQLGLSMACCVVIGFIFGRFLDRLTGASPLFMVVFAFVGSAAAIKVMYDIAKDWK